jgi:hypothetical protein
METRTTAHGEVPEPAGAAVGKGFRHGPARVYFDAALGIDSRQRSIRGLSPGQRRAQQGGDQAPQVDLHCVVHDYAFGKAICPAIEK